MEKKALGFNPQKICPMPLCPEKTSARLYDGEKRMDLCRVHALDIWRVWGSDRLEVLGVWNELTMEDFGMTDTQVTEEIEIDPNHPWVEASLSMQPLPVPTSAKWDLVHITNPKDGQSMPAVMLTCITHSGVQTYFFDPEFFQQFILMGANVLKELGEAMNKAQQGKLIVADKAMEGQVIAEQRLHEHLRNGDK